MNTIAQAYDAIADDYDGNMEADAWMRRLLWQRYEARFPPASRVLDVGCGTGIDALFLAERGRHVIGIDVSPAMVQRLRTKAKRRQLTGTLDVCVANTSSLSGMPAASFDGILSAFGGLNTTPDLKRFANDAARLLRPGGWMVLHMVNRFSIWEWLHLCRQGRWREAGRLHQRSTRRFTIGGRSVQHYQFAPGEAYARFFAAHFIQVRAYGLGVLRPPPQKRLPVPLADLLGRLEPRVGALRPLVNWGRFFVLELRLRTVYPNARHP